MKSVTGIGVASGTSTVTIRNHLPSLRSTRSACPLGIASRSAWYYPTMNGTTTRPSRVKRLTRSMPLKLIVRWSKGIAACLRNVGPDRLVPLVGLADAADAQARHLRRQAEPVADLPVGDPLKLDPVGAAAARRLSPAEPVARLVEPLDGRRRVWRPCRHRE